MGENPAIWTIACTEISVKGCTGNLGDENHIEIVGVLYGNHISGFCWFSVGEIAVLGGFRVMLC